jgi:hypothetical protein
MSNIDDGGAAFPIDSYMLNPNATEKEIKEAQGMTLRDYFAAAALTGILANHPANEIVEIGCIRSKPRAIIVASWIIADEMLKARKESQP